MRLVLAAALAAAMSTSALAQAGQVDDDIKSLARLSLEELGNLEVTTVSKTPEPLRQTPAAIYVITQDDIRRSGATTLPEALRLAPGVDVARIDSDHWSVGVRGFGDGFSKSVLVLIDGRNVYTPLFAGIFWGVQDTLFQDIDRIEVIRGPGGTVWGANAVNGIINVITKSSRVTTGILASATAGSLDHGIGEFRYGARHSDALTWRVYGKGFSRGAESHSDGQDFDTWRMGQGGFRVDWTTPRDSLTLQGDAYKAREGQSVAFGSFSPLEDVISFEPIDLSGANVLVDWRRTLARSNELELRAYYDRTSLFGPQLGEVRNTADLDFVHHLGMLPRQNIRWGVGMHVSPSVFTQTVPTLDLQPHNETDSIYSAFAQDEIALLPRRLALTVGAKLEHNNFTGAEIQPSARLLWTPTGNQSIWTAVTRAVRTPSQLEEDVVLQRFLLASPPTFLELDGNSAFQPERVVAYEAGYRLAIADRAFIDVSVFHNQHDNLQSFGPSSIAVATTPAPAHVLFVLPYANGAAGTSRGIEIAPDWKVTAWAQIKASYSYLDVDVHNTTSVADILTVIDTYNGSSPRHQITLQPLLTLPRGWEIDQAYRYVSALPARDVPSYVTLDARVAHRLARELELAVVGQNLFQDHHAEFGHDPGPIVGIARSVSVSLTWRH